MTEKDWTKTIAAKLVGRRIVGFSYMTKEEAASQYWHGRAPVLELDDGTLLYASADDEGNDAGALFSTNESLPVIPVMR